MFHTVDGERMSQRMGVEFPVLGNCWVAYLLYPGSPSQLPEDLVNPLPSYRKEEFTLVGKLLSPLQVLPHHVQGALVDGYHPDKN